MLFNHEKRDLFAQLEHPSPTDRGSREKEKEREREREGQRRVFPGSSGGALIIDDEPGGIAVRT